MGNISELIHGTVTGAINLLCAASVAAAQQDTLHITHQYADLDGTQHDRPAHGQPQDHRHPGRSAPVVAGDAVTLKNITGPVRLDAQF